MKPTKRDTTLNERDALIDLYECERALLHRYAAALACCGVRSMREGIFAQFHEAAEDCARIREEVLRRTEGQDLGSRMRGRRRTAKQLQEETAPEGSAGQQ